MRWYDVNITMEFMETIEGLSDDTMRILLEVVKQVVLPLDHKESVGSSSEHQILYCENVWGRMMMKVLIDTHIALWAL